MRRALSIGIALLMAACSVDLEGATCRAVGASDNCPVGQACGTNLKCSVKAAGCQPCVAGTVECRAEPTCEVVECTAAVDPVCGTWKAASDATGTLRTCQVPVGGTALECACVKNVVDLAGGTCAHPSITSAIAAATRFPAPVVVLGGSSFLYGNAIEDAAPIVIPSGVTLLGDEAATAAGATRIIAVQGPGPEGLQVHPGAIVQGLAVERADVAGPTVGILLTGGLAASGNTLMSVRVDAGAGGGGFETGLRVAGANAVAVSDVQVIGATVAGLEVNRLAASDVVLVTGSTFDQNQVGVSLLKGDLTLSGSTVKRSLAEGVVAVTGTASLTIRDGLIARNRSTGIVITAAQLLILERNRICGNLGSDKLYGGQTRKVGGLYSQGPRPPVLTFSGNRVHANVGDQMYVVASAGTWDISGPGGAGGCDTGLPNVFAGYSAPGVGLAALAANVLAHNNSWDVSYPIEGVDFSVLGTCGAGACAIDTGRDSGLICLPPLPADLTCPAP
jgi:hypothetical protein